MEAPDGIHDFPAGRARCTPAQSSSENAREHAPTGGSGAAAHRPLPASAGGGCAQHPSGALEGQREALLDRLAADGEQPTLGPARWVQARSWRRGRASARLRSLVRADPSARHDERALRAQLTKPLA